MASLRDLARNLRMIVMALLAVACLPSAALGQMASGAISGDVRDQAGAALAGASVTVSRIETRLLKTVTSASDGGFVCPALSPGTYDVRIELAGFRSVVQRGVDLRTGESVRLEFHLAIVGVIETVTVQEDATRRAGDASGLGQVIDARFVTGLPLNGRTFIQLAALAPGVALPPGSLLPRINGGRPRTNEYLFDGISVLQPEPGQVAFFPIPEAIAQFTVETNSPPAEFGRFNGGVINLTTRSGTNALSGSLFEFLRNEALNARNYFAATNPVKAEFRRHQFGSVLGGPLRRNRTFFFTDYQGQRQTIGRTLISTVPTTLQRQGVFTEAIGARVPAIYDPATTATSGSGYTRSPFPGNAVPMDRMDPVAQALLDRYPLPTIGGTANNFRRLENEAVDQDQADLRADHRITASGDLAFVRVSHFRESFTPARPLPDGSGVTAGTLGPQQTRAWSVASGLHRVFSNHTLNQLRLGDTRRSVSRTATTVHGSVSNAAFSDTLPTFTISGYQQLGSPANTATDFGTSVTQVADTLIWLAGRHTIKVGGDFRWERLNVFQPPSPAGTFAFSNLFTDLPGVANTGTPLASFLLGQVQTFSIDIQQQQIRHRAHIQEYFVQDDWRVADGVTVNAGLRYTLNFPSVEEHDQVGIFNLQTQQIEYAGQNGLPRQARQLHANNVGPRLGITGHMTDRTVLKTGYGLVWIEQAGITTPFTTPVFPFLQTVSQRTLDSITPAFVLANGPTVAPIAPTPDAGVGQGVFSVDRDLGSGYVQQWHVSLQRDLTSHLTVDVAYVGSKVTRVGLPDTNLNQLRVDQLSLGNALLQRVPNPYYGSIPPSSSLGDPSITVAQLLKPYPRYTTVSLYRNNVGTTLYHGVEARLEQRLSRGLSYLVSYTRSVLKDDASSVFDASILTGPATNYPVADTFDRARERDYSTGDIPHIVVASAVWALPAGRGRAHDPVGIVGAIVNDWTVTTIGTLQSGVPIAVTQTTNFNSFAGFGTQRPNLVGDPALPSNEHTVGRWFDTDAFSVAPQFTLGNASRNPVRGPAYRNVDLALIRDVPLKGMVRLQLRVEVFNLINTPPLGAPNGVLGSAAFGTITTAGDPRVIQLAAKLMF